MVRFGRVSRLSGLLAVVAATVSACTVPVGGTIGLSKTDTGDLVAVMQVCSGSHIDGATIYHDDNDRSGRWAADPAVTGFSTWSLASGANGWSVVVPLRLDPDLDYSIYGWTNDNTWSTDGPDFTAKELAALKPGEVLYPEHSGNVVRTVDGFRKAACKADP